MVHPATWLLAPLLLGFFLAAGGTAAGKPIIIGSKQFNESYILGEAMAQVLEARGYRVQRRLGLGGTLICFEALRSREIDLYPEYTGTIEQAILKLPRHATRETLNDKLREAYGLRLLRPFGFNNTYALALPEDLASRLGIAAISDLMRFPNLRMAFSHEFMERQDGWPGLAAAYRLATKPTGIQHGLAYQAIQERTIDVTDVYSTDGDIEKYRLAVLRDDKEFFPQYLAAPFAHLGVDEQVAAVVNELQGKISDAAMRRANAQVLLKGATFAEAAGSLLREIGVAQATRERRDGAFWLTLLLQTVTHLKLTLIALLAAMLVAMPLGVLVYRLQRLSRPIIYAAGLLQTIPSIALLAFMIPFFGIGVKPAIVALSLYALLPILRNTATALFSIDPLLKRVSIGMGMTTWQRLRHIELPLAAPTIMAGIKTAAVINVGTATLAAFIGAGGLGEPIVTGLALNDSAIILRGAIPAALLAVLTEFAFEVLERRLVPRHLLQRLGA
ncbi:MAG: ABC transporter permease subunit [Candidatus Tectomicrobia bacterium]|nr:ABC transporter permease subunit [Candidatus Tectomicrobia bacterium]